MAYKNISSLDSDTVVTIGGVNKKTGKKNITKVEGYYLGSKKVEDSKKKSGYSYIHVLQTSQGNLGVWGKTDLDKKIDRAVVGTMTLITCTGTRPTPKGDMYTFTVAQDPDLTIEVSLPNDGYDASAGEAEDSYEETSEDLSNNEESFSTSVPSSLGNKGAAERKAQVEAMLRQRKG